MGGTTFDVSVIHGGRPAIRDGVVIEQHDLYLRMVDVESVGAGGGSLAWIDPQSGALRVGPQSAGAEPGPVCYGRGGTVPDGHRRRSRAGPAEPRQLPRRPHDARRRGGAGRRRRPRRAARARADGVRGGDPGSRRQPHGGQDPQHDRRPRPRPARLHRSTRSVVAARCTRASSPADSGSGGSSSRSVTSRRSGRRTGSASRATVAPTRRRRSCAHRSSTPWSTPASSGSSSTLATTPPAPGWTGRG